MLGPKCEKRHQTVQIIVPQIVTGKLAEAMDENQDDHDGC